MSLKEMWEVLREFLSETFSWLVNYPIPFDEVLTGCLFFGAGIAFTLAIVHISVWLEGDETRIQGLARPLRSGDLGELPDHRIDLLAVDAEKTLRQWDVQYERFRAYTVEEIEAIFDGAPVLENELGKRISDQIKTILLEREKRYRDKPESYASY